MATITKNMGNILLKEGTKINQINQNCGNITLKENGSVDLIEHNWGSIAVKANTDIRRIRDNFGTIVIKDHCTIACIEGNLGLIVLGDNCVVESIIDCGGNLQCGLDCIVPDVATLSNPNGSSYLLYVNNCPVRINNFMGTWPLYSYQLPPRYTRAPYNQSCSDTNINDMMAGTQIPSNLMQPSDTKRRTTVAPQNKSTPQLDDSVSQDLKRTSPSVANTHAVAVALTN